MKFFLCLFCLLLLNSVAQGALEKDWKLFKQEFIKNYTSNEEDQKRFKVFKENWSNIEKHNRRYEQGYETYLQEVNRFADLTDEEFDDLYGLYSSDEVEIYPKNITLTKSKRVDVDYLDWREAGAVTAAKDQGSCGSCWIFSAVAALESYNFKKTGKLVHLSEQYIVDCYSNSSCDGGDPEAALDFMKENGVYLETDYPYNAQQNECKNLTKPTLPVLYNTSVFINSTKDDVLKTELKKHGPISSCLFVNHKWRFYKSGVWYHNECSMDSNHCILLVGYGVERGNEYWLFKNSWSTKWGDNGFIKVARNKHLNYCGINFGNSYIL